MATTDDKKDLKMDKIRSEIKEGIFNDIREKKLFGKMCLWQSYMVRDFMNNYPRELREQVALVIGELVDDKILEPNEHGYKLTPRGEDLVYESNYYTVDDLINKIMIHFREKDYYENTRWPRLTAMSFFGGLIAYEQRLFDSAIKKMLDEDLLVFDEGNNAFVITKKCQNKMFGLE